ncbi:MAG: Uncharacterized protein XD63_0385 [Thermoanaerobacterales bacterium 50_218]|nr:MAG: Uncharacterized protein XD63_0385 [Thermoanaerobacterales bacterium 50_218]HAA90735.1 hypothetical protein [Peptococcaceae bacterium]
MFWNVMLIVVISAGMVFCEVPKLMHRQMWRELWAFSVFLAIGLAGALALALDLPLPNPIRLIEFIFGPLSKLIYSG